MHPPYYSPLQSCRMFVVVLIALALTLSCAPPVQRPTGPAAEYDAAKDVFRRGRLAQALEFTEGLATASPPTSYTGRARLLRAVIYTGQIKSYKELVDAYAKGAENTKNPHFKAEYERLRHDNLQYGARAALGLAETVHQLVPEGIIGKEHTLEVPYPATEGPFEVKALFRVKEGGWVEPDQQEMAAIESMQKGVDDALADIVAGDRSKARTLLSAGPVKMDGVDLALFLGNQLLEGASIFDRKHDRDPQRLRTVCGEAEEVAKAALELLKENPNKEKEKAVKKLQDQIKATLKNT